MEAAHFSGRPRVGGLTIVTSGAANRLFMLDAMCADWVGPLAVAILVAVLDTAAEHHDAADGRLGGKGSLMRCVSICCGTPVSAALKVA